MNGRTREQRKQWIVTPETLPKVRRRCPKCGRKTEFENSGKFRVNGNGRLLDVWLIYRCQVCKSTWNLEIYERVSPESIEQGEYERFLSNDAALAAAYGTSRELFARNMAEVVESAGAYTVTAAESAALCKEAGVEEIEVKIEGGFKIRADLLFAEQLKITRSQARKLFDQGCVWSDGAVMGAGGRVRDGQIFSIFPPKEQEQGNRRV